MTEGPSGRFEVLTDGRILVASDDLDRESYSLYSFRVRVYDLGVPNLAAEASVVVHVSDVNDGVPLFGKAVYHINILETVVLGSVVLVAHVEDMDLGQNAVLTFDIEEGYQNFLIEQFNTTVNVDNGATIVSFHRTITFLTFF